MRSTSWSAWPGASTMPVCSRRPERSTHTSVPALIITSVTSGSARSGSSGPRPSTRAITRDDERVELGRGQERVRA